MHYKIAIYIVIWQIQLISLTSKVGNTVTATYFFVRIVWEIGFLYVTKNLGIVDFDKNYLAESFMKENVSGLDLIWKKIL